MTLIHFTIGMISITTAKICTNHSDLMNTTILKISISISFRVGKVILT